MVVYTVQNIVARRDKKREEKKGGDKLSSTNVVWCSVR